jgi:hypothetical protein
MPTLLYERKVRRLDHRLTVHHIGALCAHSIFHVVNFKPAPFSLNMPTESSFPNIDIPNVDTWDFLFSRTDREYPDDKGMSFPVTML